MGLEEEPSVGLEEPSVSVGELPKEVVVAPGRSEGSELPSVGLVVSSVFVSVEPSVGVGVALASLPVPDASGVLKRSAFDVGEPESESEALRGESVGAAPDEPVAVIVEVSDSVEGSVDALLASEDSDGGRPQAGVSVPKASLPVAVAENPPDIPREPLAVADQDAPLLPLRPKEPEPVSDPLPVPELPKSVGVLPPLVSVGDVPVKSVGLFDPSDGEEPSVGTDESVGDEPEVSVASLGDEESVGEPPGASVEPPEFEESVGEEPSVTVGDAPEVFVESVGDDESVGREPGPPVESVGDELSEFKLEGGSGGEPLAPSVGKILVASAVLVGERLGVSVGFPSGDEPSVSLGLAEPSVGLPSEGFADPGPDGDDPKLVSVGMGMSVELGMRSVPSEPVAIPVANPPLPLEEPEAPAPPVAESELKPVKLPLADPEVREPEPDEPVPLA